MMIALSIIMLIIGLIVIVKSADWFVGASVTIAHALRIPPMIIGATIVSIGTTLPELITSVTAVALGNARGGSADYNALAIGNSIGSMCCNLGLILAISLIARSGMADKSFAAKGAFLLVLSAVLSIFVASKRQLEIYEGVILLLLFVLFIVLNIVQALSHRKTCLRLAPSDARTPLVPYMGKIDCTMSRDNMLDSRQCALSISPNNGGYASSAYCAPSKSVGLLLAIKFVVGSAGIAIGAFVMVNSASRLCTIANIPTQIVGATVLAIGTSLPELATAISAIIKGEAALSMGNLIGANVINATLLLGTITLVGGELAVDNYTALYGVIFMMVITAIAVIPTALRGKTSRIQGISLLLAYIAMITVNILFITR